MKNSLIYLLGFTVFFSCHKIETERKYSYFSSTDLKIDSLHKKNVKFKSIISTDSVKLFNDQGLMTQFKYSISDTSINFVKDKKISILYSFTDSTNIARPNELLPLFYKNVRLVNKKDYQINDKKKTIYHFIESGYDETLDSYYLEGEGFICFYKYSDKHFLYLDSPNSIEVSSQFLTDSTFFSMLKMRNTDKMMGRKFE